jgi:hypothetical protein
MRILALVLGFLGFAVYRLCFHRQRASSSLEPQRPNIAPDRSY